MQGDTPIHRKTFLEMSDEEQILFIQQLQKRRLESVNTYTEIKEAKRKVELEKLNTKLEKKLAAFEKCNAQCEKYLNQLTEKANELKMLKLQIDIS
jgi:hypothetical protein